MLIKATLPLPELRRVLQDRVNETRSEKISCGFFWNGHTYDTDARSLSNLMSTVSAVAGGIPLPAGFVWRSSDNQNVPHDEQSIKQLAGSLLWYVSAVYAHSFALKNAIEGSDNPASIDVTNEWPAP